MASGYTNLLEEALESWGLTRQGVIAELQIFPPDRYDFRPSPRSRSVAELARHIVESGLVAVGELSREDGDFTRQPYAKFLTDYTLHVAKLEAKDELIFSLQQTFTDAEASFRQVGELFMLQFIRRFDGQRGTRLAWLWHAIDHESYHRGQLAVYARLLGLVPALTRAIHGEQ